MELKDTIEMMTSADYKERFKAEYCQLAIRFKKLREMFKNWDYSHFKSCPRQIYINQLDSMNRYMFDLEQRAELENIELPDFNSL